MRYCVSHDPKAMYSASERKYTAAGGDVQVPWGGIYDWRKSEQRDWYTSFQFLSRSFFRSSPVVMILRWRLKEYSQKNKRQRWDICEEFSVWHFVTKSTGLKSANPRMSTHFSESRDPSCVSSAMCPECPRKEWRTKSFKLQSTPTGKRSKVRPTTRWNDYITDHVWSRLNVESAERSEITLDREAFRVLTRLLPSRLSPKE